MDGTSRTPTDRREHAISLKRCTLAHIMMRCQDPRMPSLALGDVAQPAAALDPTSFLIVSDETATQKGRVPGALMCGLVAGRRNASERPGFLTPGLSVCKYDCK